MILRDIIIAAAMLSLCSNHSTNCNAFSTTHSFSITQSTSSPSSPLSPLYMATSETEETSTKRKEGYVPKWKKKATLADSIGDLAPQDKGLVGSIPITFQQGTGESATRIETTAMPGQPLKLVASQAGQFVKYGCVLFFTLMFVDVQLKKLNERQCGSLLQNMAVFVMMKGNDRNCETM